MKEKSVYRGSFLDVVQREVTLPNGHEITLDLVKHPGASAIVPFVADDRVAMIRQYRHATGGDLLEVPAGKLDPGESPDTCAARELEEETGWRAGRLESLGFLWASPGFTDEKIYLYAAFDLERRDARLEEDEVIETFELDLGEALEKIWSGEISDGKTIVALLRAAQRVGKIG